MMASGSAVRLCKMRMLLRTGRRVPSELLLEVSGITAGLTPS